MAEASEEKTKVEKWKGVVTVRRIKHEGMVLRLAKIPCGKVNCGKCPHGPYWYLEFRSRGKWRHRYIGKELGGARLDGDPALARMVDLVMKRGKEDGACDGSVGVSGQNATGADRGGTATGQG